MAPSGNEIVRDLEFGTSAAAMAFVIGADAAEEATTTRHPRARLEPGCAWR